MMEASISIAPPQRRCGPHLCWAVTGLLSVTGMVALAGCAHEVVMPGVSRVANHMARSHHVAPELAAVLGNLAQASSNKCQLSFLAGFKGLSPGAARFNQYMAKSQKTLLNELQNWAHTHHLVLRPHRRRGLFAVAAKIQNSSDAHALLSTSGAQFERLYLLLMYTDYSWQIQLDKAALRFTTPPVPIAYLEHALAVNRRSRSLILQLLSDIKTSASDSALVTGPHRD